MLAIDRGDCDGAQKQLVRLQNVRGSDAVLTARLLARSYMCASHPDPKKASEAYALAEREAKKANAQLSLAEIYTEFQNPIRAESIIKTATRLRQQVWMETRPEVRTQINGNLSES